MACVVVTPGCEPNVAALDAHCRDHIARFFEVDMADAAAIQSMMAERGFGRIVNIASVRGLVASRDKAPYVAAKHGLIGLSKVAALEYAELEYADAGDRASGGVTVICICPGWTETAIIELQIQARADSLGVNRDAAIASLLGD